MCGSTQTYHRTGPSGTGDGARAAPPPPPPGWLCPPYAYECGVEGIDGIDGTPLHRPSPGSPYSSPRAPPFSDEDDGAYNVQKRLPTSPAPRTLRHNEGLAWPQSSIIIHVCTYIRHPSASNLNRPYRHSSSVASLICILHRLSIAIIFPAYFIHELLAQTSCITVPFFHRL